MRKRIALIVTVLIVGVVGEFAVGARVSAAPAEVEVAAEARIQAVEMASPRWAKLTVHSPSMQRGIRVDVLLPEDRSAANKRPTLYMLDGIDAGVYTGYRESGWTQFTDLVDFMADKNVNVVLPIGGTGSYYTDWQRDDPVLGRNRWETFLADELPPLIDRQFAGNGRNAIEGLSMGATGALMLAVRNPSLYAGAALFSGCLDFRDQTSQQALSVSVRTRGGNPDNMWGPAYNQAWRDHDPALNIAALRGKPLYVATGSGLPDWSLGPAGLASPAGGAIEAGALACTRTFEDSARSAGVPVTYDYREGLHSWGYWKEDLHRSWPTIAEALGV